MNADTQEAAVLESVDKGFRSGNTTLQVLKDINIRISKGEFVAIMGASGSGKTTLLNVMGGLLAADKGRVSIAGNDLYGMSDQKLTIFRREQIGFVFQMYNLVDSLTVAQNILLPKLAGNKSLSGKERSDFDKLVRRIGLEDRLNHKPSQLSGGEQQRVAIARALINQPALVLSDEPTGNLDSDNTAMLGELIQSLHEENGAAFVLVTHDPAVAMWADRLLVLKDGCVIGDSPVSRFNTAEELAVFYQRQITDNTAGR